MDVLAYLLCYSLEVKDKPREAHRGVEGHRLRSNLCDSQNSMVYVDHYPISFRPSLPRNPSLQS